MSVELDSETRIVIGRLRAPSDPGRPWWWQSSTTVDGNDVVAAGEASTERDAILQAAAGALQARGAAADPGDAHTAPADKEDMSAVGDDGQVFGG